MNKPNITYIQVDCEECDIYDPTEADCSECICGNNETFELMDETDEVRKIVDSTFRTARKEMFRLHND